MSSSQRSLAVKPVRIADIVAERIEKMILEGALRPGEKLIAERDLADKLGVSRPSLRDALSKLEQKGLLGTNKGGTYVGPFLAPFADPLDALFSDDQRVTADYFEYRTIMEANAARLAASRLTDIDRDNIKACLASLTVAHQAEDPRAEADADADLHLLIYEASHNVVLLHIMRVISGMLRKGVFYNRERLYRRAGVREILLAQHVDIAQAVLAGDPAQAEKTASDHVRFTFDTIEDIRRDEMRREASQRRNERRDLLADQS